jgi:ATP-binding protein involved in chromosome partitioning
LADVRRIVMVGSGKGGVGKSTLTYHLARALSAGGARTAILDADLEGPSQGRLAGIGDLPPVPTPSGKLELPRSACGIGVATMASFVPEAAPVTFPAAAAGESYTWRPIREVTFLAQLVGSVRWGDLDWLLVDLPPGTEKTAQHAELLGPRASVVLVTVPSALSSGVVARTVTALRAAGRPAVGYVENMRGYHCRSCGSVEPLFPGSSRDLELPCLGSVPFDPRLAEPSELGRPEPASGPVATALSDVAAELEAVLAEPPRVAASPQRGHR